MKVIKSNALFLLWQMGYKKLWQLEKQYTTENVEVIDRKQSIVEQLEQVLVAKLFLISSSNISLPGVPRQIYHSVSVLSIICFI